MTRISPAEVFLEPDGEVLVQTPDDDVLFTPLQIRTVFQMSPEALEKCVELLDGDGAGDCS